MRLVSLSPSFTETLLYFGSEKEIFGITEECPASGHAARIGTSKALKIDRILDLKPDLVIADRRENRPEEIRKLESQARTVSFEVISLPSLIAAIAELGQLTEKEESAKELIRAIYAVWFNPPREKVPTLLLLWNTPFLTVNNRTYASQLIEAGGGLNVFGQEPVPEIPIEIEDMIDQKPELLLLAAAPFPFTEKHVNYFKGLPDFSQKSVQLIDGDLFLRFGPRTVTALKTLRTVIEKVGASV